MIFKTRYPFSQYLYSTLHKLDPQLERDFENEDQHSSKQSRSCYCPWTLGVSLFFNCVFLIILLSISYQGPIAAGPNPIHTGLNTQATKEVAYRWYSPYSSPNFTDIDEVEKAWSAIVPDFGLVAVDHLWAQERGAWKTMDLPSDPRKGIYVVEAYHTMHCLVALRKTYFEIARGKHPTVPFHHVSHCFDALRQHIQCAASDTLLYTYGNHSSGDGQPRQCRNWDYLRQWTLEHSTCNSMTGEAEPIFSHYNICGLESDGLHSYG